MTFAPGEIAKNGAYGRVEVLKLAEGTNSYGDRFYRCRALEYRDVGPMDPPQQVGEIGLVQESCLEKVEQ